MFRGSEAPGGRGSHRQLLRPGKVGGLRCGPRNGTRARNGDLRLSGKCPRPAGIREAPDRGWCLRTGPGRSWAADQTPPPPLSPTHSCARAGIARSSMTRPLTCGAGVDHPGQGQLVLQVQHGLAHLGGAGVLGFVALVKHNLGWTWVKDCSGRRAVPQTHQNTLGGPFLVGGNSGRCLGGSGHRVGSLGCVRPPKPEGNSL